MTTSHEVKRIINQAVRNDGHFPTLQNLCTSLNFTADQVRKYMDSLVEDGYLDKIGTWYKFAENQRFSEPEEVTTADMTAAADSLLTEMLTEPEKRKRGRPFGTTKTKIESVQAVPEPLYEAKKPQTYKTQIKIVRTIMGITGIISAVVSIYFSYLYLLLIMNSLLSILMASVLVGFSIGSVEVIVIVLSDKITHVKSKKWSLICLMTFLFLVVTSLSMLSTVAAQINKSLQITEEKINSSDNKSKQTWAILQEAKAQNKERMEGEKEQLSLLMKEYANESRESQKKIFLRKIKQQQEIIRKLNESINNVREKEFLTINNNKDKEWLEKTIRPSNNFYRWIEDVIGISGSKIQLIMSILLSIFLDILAPIGISISMFLKGDEN